MKEPKEAAKELAEELPRELFSEKSWDMLCFASYILFSLRHNYPFIEDNVKNLLTLIHTYHQIEIKEDEQKRTSSREIQDGDESE